jgi:glycosyltransferase involved in cell wall biosynthesis
MFKGSGINIKMFDYMSYGLPIVTTQCGARGIQTNGKIPMLISSPERFCQDIKILYENKPLQIEMSEAGRQLVREQYDWQRISANLQETLLQRIEERTGCVK